MTFVSLFQPIRVNGLTLRNRIVLPAHGPRVGPDRYIRYLEERVKHVALLICSTPVAAGISAYSPGPPSNLASGRVPDSDARLPNPVTELGSRFFDEAHLPLMRRQAELAHKYGSACFGQLVHTGNYTFAPDWQAGLSPSGVPDEMLGEIPHVMTTLEIHGLIETFARAAARVKAADMDGLEIHACHGLLLNAFLSPITNHRADEYGGTLENRARLLREVIAACRARVGRGFPLGIRIAVKDSGGGLTSDDVVSILSLVASEIDYVSVSAGSESGRKNGVTIPTVMSADYPPAVFAAAAKRIRGAIKLPVILAGRIVDPATATRVLDEGSADLVGLVRALLADPDWIQKARDGNADDIRLCTGNNECRQRTQFRVRGLTAPIACAVNAEAGREEEIDRRPAASRKHVVIVGGGPAGLEAARVAMLRGHSVTLCEKESVLGGQALIAALDPRSAGLRSAVAYLTRQVEKQQSFKLQLGAEVTSAEIIALRPDAVIVATGSLPPLIPPSAEHLILMSDVLGGTATPGHRVCVVAGLNGHRAPLGVAALLAERGHHVDLLTERLIVGEDLDPGTNHTLLRLLLGLGVGLHPLTSLRGFDERTVRMSNTLTGTEDRLENVDSVVLATPGRANDALFRELQDLGVHAQAIGDCLAPRRMIHAVLEGYRAAHAV